MSTPETELHFADTPEAALIVNPALDPSCFNDILNANLARQAAIVEALLHSTSHEPPLPRQTHINLLWTLQGQIEQIKVIADKTAHAQATQAG